MGGENCYDKMDPYFLTLLDDLRDAVGEPLYLTSTYRSPDYNRSINGASRSKHLEGIAADISCNNGTLRAKIIKEALNMGLTVGAAKTCLLYTSDAADE